jgi:ATP-binding cassette subfamily B protein
VLHKALDISQISLAGDLTQETTEAVARAARAHTGATHALVVLIDLDEGPDRIDFGGTIWIAIATAEDVAFRRSRILGGREWLRLGAVELGLDCLRRYLQRLPVAFHDSWQSGQLLSRATSDLGVIRRFMSFGLIFLIVNVATYVTVIGLLFQLYWPLAAVVVAGSIPLFYFSREFTRRYFIAARLMQDQQGDLATLVEESTQGLRTVKAYGRRPQLAAQFAASARQVHDTGVGKALLTARTWSQFDLVPNVTLAIVLVGGAYAVSADQMTIGGLVAFVSLELMLIWPIDALGWIISNLQESMTAADRIYEVFDSAVTIADRPDAVTLEPASVAGALRFEGVEFRFPDAEAPVIRGVDLDIRPGETVALVGVTGSGKSALIGLVPRLPSALLATGLVLLSFVSFTCGLILDSVSRGRQELKRLAYLSVPGIGTILDVALPQRSRRAM